MVIFNSYVSSPEGKCAKQIPQKTTDLDCTKVHIHFVTDHRPKGRDAAEWRGGRQATKAIGWQFLRNGMYPLVN
jgi:hypothetical protein